jgi:hypothetical protein
MDMSRGYEIKPASEGGFVVHGKPVTASPFSPPGVTETPATVAFSNAKDLIVWLAKYGPWMAHDGTNINPVTNPSHVVQADMGQGVYGTGSPDSFVWSNVIAYRRIFERQTDDVKRCSDTTAQAIREHDQRRS